MTLCYGWIDQDNAYLVGDSAVTCALESLSVEQNTSFNEPTIINETSAVYEGALKVFNIDDRFCIAIAGNSTKAYDYCRWLIHNHKKFKSIKETIASFIISHSPFSTNREDFVSLLIITVEDSPKLYKWDMDSPEKICEGDNIYVIGNSLLDYSNIPSILTNLIYSTEKLNNFTNIRKLNFSTSVYQSHIILNESLKDGVGGVVTGVMMDKNKSVNWNIDTNYVFFSGEDINWSIVGHRGNATAAYSQKTNKKNLYLNSDCISFNSIEEFYNKTREELEELLLSESSYSWVFINKAKRRVVIINNKPFYKNDIYMTINKEKVTDTITDEQLLLDTGFIDYMSDEKINKYSPIIWIGSRLNMQGTKFDVAIMDR